MKNSDIYAICANIWLAAGVGTDTYLAPIMVGVFWFSMAYHADKREKASE